MVICVEAMSSSKGEKFKELAKRNELAHHLCMIG
jgi:hypothetical protein